MPLQKQQRNEVFERIREVGLDPLDFEWAGEVPGLRVDGIRFRPLGYAQFDFRFDDRADWGFDYKPGPGLPQAAGWAGPWIAELSALSQWLKVCQAEVEAPDLWGALQREREALARPGAEEGSDKPFTPDELEVIAREMDALKAYAREAFELSNDQLREIDAKLDYLTESAGRAPRRIDWWNQAVGAFITLTVTASVHPGVAEGLLSMTAHSLGHLFGGGPPQLPA